MLIRSIRDDDLDQLYQLSLDVSFGLTSLPRDRDILARKIYKSVRSHEKITDRPGDEAYLFVLETDQGKIIGSAGMQAKVGGFEPFYSYKLEKLIHESRQLNIRKEIKVLHLIADHNGPTEIGSLFLDPAYRGGGYGCFLSLVRFLFMADHLERFEKEAVAEMRGVSDDQGRCPFWDGLGKQFFDIDFPLADYLSIKNKRFIAELMPSYPIYMNLLPAEACEVIGMVHEKTRGALRILLNEGFYLTEKVDIFDGGPLIQSTVSKIRTIRESRRAIIEAIKSLNDDDSDDIFYISNASRTDFRAIKGSIRVIEEGMVALDNKVAELLQVGRGDSIRYIAVSK